eukprot:GHVT01068185.1.p2 GENE.GHVT01068185.1~~GHVT01068185.1.p2  ORF type:complete len:113 (+),score=21.40 GHVT01068185.1:19-357(+)
MVGRQLLQPVLRLSRPSLGCFAARAAPQGLSIPIPKFNLTRHDRRLSSLEMDRGRFFYWNLLSVALTTLPLVYIWKINYKVCPESEEILKRLDPQGNAKVSHRFTKDLFAPV